MISRIRTKSTRKAQVSALRNFKKAKGMKTCEHVNEFPDVTAGIRKLRLGIRSQANTQLHRHQTHEPLFLASSGARIC